MDFEETCKIAADHLGLRFMGSSWTPREDRRAGCFWRSDGTVEFNKMVDPLKTNPEEFHEYGGKVLGGVCGNPSKQPYYP